MHLEVVSHYEHIEEQICHHNNLLVRDVLMDVQYDPIMVFKHTKNFKILVSKTEDLNFQKVNKNQTCYLL